MHNKMTKCWTEYYSKRCSHLLWQYHGVHIVIILLVTLCWNDLLSCCFPFRPMSFLGTDSMLYLARYPICNVTTICPQVVLITTRWKMWKKFKTIEDFKVCTVYNYSLVANHLWGDSDIQSSQKIATDSTLNEFGFVRPKKQILDSD